MKENSSPEGAAADVSSTAAHLGLFDVGARYLGLSPQDLWSVRHFVMRRRSGTYQMDGTMAWLGEV